MFYQLITATVLLESLKFTPDTVRISIAPFHRGPMLLHLLHLLNFHGQKHTPYWYLPGSVLCFTNTPSDLPYLLLLDN